VPPVYHTRKIATAGALAIAVVLALLALWHANASARSTPYVERVTHRLVPVHHRKRHHGHRHRHHRRTVSAGASAAEPVQNHVETWAYDDSESQDWCNGGAGASPSLVRQWLTYAETNCGPDSVKALADCHDAGTTYCTVLQYFNPNLVYTNNDPAKLVANAPENWWLHQPGYTDAAHRLSWHTDWGTAYGPNQSVPAVDDWLASYLRAKYSAWDGLILDDTSASLPQEFYGTGFSSSQEITSDAGLVAAHAQLASALTRLGGAPFIKVMNGINPDPDLKPALPVLGKPSSVVGLVAEGQPWSGDSLSDHYPGLLDEMARVDSMQNRFMVLLSYDSQGSLKARRLQAATVLLGYSPGHIVSWSNLETSNNDLAVWPEEGIYPTAALQSMARPGGRGCLAGAGVLCSRGGHNDIQVADGVYRREFGSCYQEGKAFGRCAVIVNDTSAPVTVRSSWLSAPYSHEITMHGGDVQSGGTVDVAGASFSADSTRIPADDAILLAG
jgi:hypothetical protein